MNSDELFQSIRNIQSQAESNLPFIEEGILNIIETKSQDCKRIEATLDILLDYQFVGVGADAFNRLNNYYRTFDEEAFQDWKKIQDSLDE